MKLVCLGANNPEVIKIFNAIKMINEDFTFLGYIDNNEKKWGTDFYGYPVFGGKEKVSELNKEDIEFCNLITRDCVTRYETSKELVDRGAILANLIHPNVNLEMVKMGIGNYIQGDVILQANVCIGNNSSISSGCLVAHETTIGNSVFLAPGCILSGKITVEDGVFIGTGVSIVPRVKIGKWSILGAGTVITKDVPPYSVVAGVPGKVIKNVEKKYVSGDVL